MQKLLLAVAALALLGSGVALKPLAVAPAYAACDPGDRLDNMTLEQARKIIMAAGYSNVHIETRGCDNVWHGTAMKDGKSTRVALEPSGKVYPEGD
jgi:hypothetical protein